MQWLLTLYVFRKVPQHVRSMHDMARCGVAWHWNMNYIGSEDVHIQFAQMSLSRNGPYILLT